MREVIIYRCNLCGNIVVKLKDGGGTLTCCGQPMEKLTANTVDASLEKHVPVATEENGVLHVAVGAVEHPMTEEHHIEWILLDTGERFEVAYLQPGMKPEADFPFSKGKATVYEYCNLHGLWKTEL